MNRFDIPFLAIQSGFLVALAFVPVFAVAVFSPRRRWALPVVLTCGIVAWALVFYLTVGEVGRYLQGEAPYRPFRVGPSIFGLWDSFRWFVLVFWIPVLGAYLAVRTLIPWRPGRRSIVGGLLLCAIVATTLAWWSSLEDTFVAPGFSWRSWSTIRQGMTRAEVHSLLGPPLPSGFQPAFARDENAETWASHLSVGYFAVVWFEQDRVKRIRLWYAD